MTSEVVMWLPCDEGSGTVLNNDAGAGTKSFTGLAATAWDNYNATTRPAVALASGSSVDLINETPFNLYGNPQAPAPYNAFTVALLRYSGSTVFALFEPGDDPSAHSFGYGAGNWNFSSGDRLFKQIAGPSGSDRIFGVACFTEPVLRVNENPTAPAYNCNFRDVFYVVEYDPSDLSIVSEDYQDLTAFNEDTALRGYGNDGGYSHSNFDFISVGVVPWELYGGLHGRVTYGERPAAFASASHLRTVCNDMFADWLGGTKTYPTSEFEAIATNNDALVIGFNGRRFF